nr:MAG TPA: hypothetical protein [Caudoviricetes sp.]
MWGKAGSGKKTEAHTEIMQSCLITIEFDACRNRKLS